MILIMSFLKNDKIKLQSCRGHEFLKLLYALFLFKVIYIIVGSIFNYIWYAIITIVVEVVGPTQKFHEKFREINFTKKFHEIDNKRHTASISSVHDHWLVQQTLVCTKHWDQIVNFFFLNKHWLVVLIFFYLKLFKNCWRANTNLWWILA